MKNKNFWEYYNPKFEYENKYPVVDKISAWIGHKNFAYDLVRNIKPKIIVELGTHYGASFFSFCQAVKDEKLKTKLFAIDIWQGDKHTGFYGNEVYSTVKNIVNDFYKDLNISLIKNTFDEAVNKFKNASIDILHIDGLHTYKAVKHDFQTWLKKTAKDGIIILHDTHEDKDDFGVFKLWKKIKKKFNTLEFEHSHGLGIIIKNKKLYKKIFIYQNIWQKYYSHLAEYNKNIKKINELLFLINENNQLKKQIDILQQENEYLKKTLQKITSSKTYRLWQRYCKIRDKILMKIRKNDNN